MSRKKKKNKNELDARIQELILLKRDLILKEDNHKITKKLFEKQMPLVENELNRLIQTKIKQLWDLQVQRDKEEKQEPQVEQSKPKKRRKKSIKKPVVKPKPITDSYSSLIFKALHHPKIDSEAKVVAIVLEWKPGIHKEDLRRQVRNMISGIKNKKDSRYLEYDWDKEQYKVIKSCQTIL